MARWWSEFLILLLFLRPLLALAGGDDEGGNSTEGNKLEVHQRYLLVWNAPTSGPRSSLVELEEDIESVECTSDANCTAALCGLDIALSYDTSLPSRPYCNYSPEDKEPHHHHHHGAGHCTCGPGKCVSYSRDFYSNGEPFYYCGPCGWVGAQCYNTTCTHPLAECKGGYCECVNNGIFYDLTFCYIPFYGKQLAVGMLVTTFVIVLICCVLGYSYHRISNRRQRRLPESWFRRSVRRQPPANDTPPTYDDVVDKLPSYQDALQMNTKESSDVGLVNVAFEAELFTSLPSNEEKVSAALSTPTSTPSSTSTSTPSSTSTSTKSPTSTSTAKVPSVSTTKTVPVSSTTTLISTSKLISTSISTSEPTSTCTPSATSEPTSTSTNHQKVNRE
nr:uncharacterized protein LOC123774881 isoform X2 [Procambarus clarkii]